MSERAKNTVCFLLSLNAHIWLVGLLSLQTLQTFEVPYREILLVRLPEKLEENGFFASEGKHLTSSIPALLSEPHQIKLPSKKQLSENKVQPRVSMKVVRRPAEEYSQEHPLTTPIEKTAPRLRPATLWQTSALNPSTPLSLASWKHNQSAISAHVALHKEPNLTTNSASQDLSVPISDAVKEVESTQVIGDPRHREGELSSPLEVIQARIDAVTPLVHRTSVCRTRHGVALVKFLMNRHGYKEAHLVTRSSGSPCLDAQIEEILHLAEPYPYIAGWVPVEVKFRY